MIRLLKVGDIFISDTLNNMLYGEIVHTEGNVEPFISFDVLHTEDYECDTVVVWTEKKEDGWTRTRETKVKTKVVDPIFKNAIWEVIATEITGGGTAMGPHDIFPDGHYVSAKRVNGTETLHFYQTGCFRGMIEPKDITLIDNKVI